jgi:acyl-[acyl-carrier-protein]-phospholipid O-acyltransferase/long-chain-fatty-acid--[acyl-carrier-protein] ligase
MQEMIFASRPQQTLYAALCDAAEIHGRRRRLLEDVKQVEYSYNDLLKMALMLGRQIERLTQPGERVGLLLPNLAPTVGLIFGLTPAAAFRPCSTTRPASRPCRRPVDAAELKHHHYLARLRRAGQTGRQAGGPAGVQLVYLEDVRECIGLGDKLWLVLWALHFPRAFALTASPEDAAVVLFTSGSEGKPKGVVLPHRAILANIAQIRSVIDFSVYDKVLNALPIFHSFGLTAGACCRCCPAPASSSTRRRCTTG